MRPTRSASFSYAADGGPYTEGRHVRPDPHLGAPARRPVARQQRIDPGREVDLIADSQGGVVVLAFLKLVYDPADPTYPPLGKVITLSSPLQGAPLATLADEIRDFPGAGHQALNLIDAAPGPIPDLDTRAVEDLAEDSPFMAELDAARLPESVELDDDRFAVRLRRPGRPRDGRRRAAHDHRRRIRGSAQERPDRRRSAHGDALGARRTALAVPVAARCRTRVAHPARDHPRRDGCRAASRLTTGFVVPR